MGKHVAPTDDSDELIDGLHGPQLRLVRADGTVIILKPTDTFILDPRTGWPVTRRTANEVLSLINRNDLRFC